MSYERNARAALAALNINPKGHLPEHGTLAVHYTIPEGKHKGTQVRTYVRAKIHAQAGKHRLMAECPRCYQIYTVGCIQQHLDACVTKERPTDPLLPNQKNG